MSKSPSNKRRGGSASSRPGNMKLGRGLSALMSDISVPAAPKKMPAKKPVAKKTKPKPKAVTAKAPTSTRGTQEISIDRIERNPDQPRRHFDKALMFQLTNSIRDKGVLQPILVRPLPRSYEAKGLKIKGRYQIVAGERRWQAALQAGLDSIPALVRALSDREVLEVGVVENVQRADLNPIEEARAYQTLKDQFGRKQDDIAKAIGKSRSHVANVMRLLNLPARAQELLANGDISAGHARAILSAPDPQSLADAILENGLSVRQAEEWVRAVRKAADGNVRLYKPEPKQKDADTRAIEKSLTEHLGLAVTLNHKSPGGSLTIKYQTPDQLDELIERLKRG